MELFSLFFLIKISFYELMLYSATLLKLFAYIFWGRLEIEKNRTLKHMWLNILHFRLTFLYLSHSFNCKKINSHHASFWLQISTKWSITLSQGPPKPLPTHRFLVSRNHPSPSPPTGYDCLNHLNQRAHLFSCFQHTWPTWPMWPHDCLL
jgi:hypothetical protein